MQKRSSIPLARYLVVAAATFVVGCGDTAAEAPSAPIPADGEAISRGAYSKPLGAAVEPEHALEDGAYRKRLLTRFTSITPENAMKWEVIEPERGEFEFGEADRLVDFARRTGKRVRGHPLVWDQQLPDWVEDGDWAPVELKRIMRDHIRAVAGRYRDRIDEWDVVNEPLDDDGGWTQNIWYRTLGPYWVAYAFEVAHRVDPGAKLFLNEIYAEERGPKSRALLGLAGLLKRRGVPIDGIGFQHHLTGGDAPSPARMRKLFRAARRLGLSAAVTELDVGEASEQRQARIYADVARTCAGASNCTGVTTWGVTDRWSWLGSEAGALPYDEDGKPKPALRALTRPLRR